MGATHKTLPLPHPQKRGLLVEFEEAIFLANPLSCLPPQGTKYSQFKKLFSTDFNRKFGDYVFTEQGPNSSAGNPTLYFAPPISDSEANIPFKTETRFGNHYWPPILKALSFIKDNSVPISVRAPGGATVFASRYYHREVYIPSVAEGTRFTEDFFIYPYEPIIPQHDTPMPTRVSWDFLGTRGSFEECLHEKIDIPSLRTAFAAYTTANIGAFGSLTGQTFPATNFTSWEDYVVSDGYSFENGVYLRKRITVTPPPEPEFIIR